MKINSSRKSLISNFFSLSVVQIAGYVIPLISVPYLLRTIGTDKYGLFSLAGAFGAYFQVILDYGFNISAIRDISKHRNEISKVSHIISGVMSAKLILLVFSLLIANIVIAIIPRLCHDFTVYFILLFTAIGTSFLPSWYFQGIERMKILAVINLSTKMIYLILIFIFVKSQNDFSKLLLISVVSTCITAVIGIVIMMQQVTFKIQIKLGLEYIKKGFGIFTTQFWATVLQASNIFVLGLFFGNKEVGIYAVAEKIIKAAISMGVPLCSTVYPRSGMLFKQSTELALQFLRKFLMFGSLLMASGSLLLCIAAPLIAEFVVGHPSPDVSLLIRILSILPFTIFVDNIYGTQILFNVNKEKSVIRIVTISAIVALIMLVSLTPVWGQVGTALSYLVSELLILILMTISIWKLGISPLLSINSDALQSLKYELQKQ